MHFIVLSVLMIVTITISVVMMASFWIILIESRFPCVSFIGIVVEIVLLI